MSVALHQAIDVISIGVTPYSKAWEMQLSLHRQVRDGERLACLLLLEHKPVLTLGKHSDANLILNDPSALAASGVEIIRCDRGGEVTAHMPGQLVIYPILPLQRLKLGAKAYVDKLVETMIRTLQEFDIQAYSDSQRPGVWVDNQKICAVGIRIQEKVSLHGMALNISNHLGLFRSIVPCGIRDRAVCSMQSLLARPPSRVAVEACFVKNFCKAFDLAESKISVY